MSRGSGRDLSRTFGGDTHRSEQSPSSWHSWVQLFSGVPNIPVTDFKVKSFKNKNGVIKYFWECANSVWNNARYNKKEAGIISQYIQRHFLVVWANFPSGSKSIQFSLSASILRLSAPKAKRSDCPRNKDEGKGHTPRIEDWLRNWRV